MSRVNYRQDMPPKGGYEAFRFSRHLPKRGPNGTAIMLGGVAVMAFGFYVIKKTNEERRALKREKLNARLTLLPLLQAEEDRRVLRSLLAAEEEEAQIMAGVPGWTVGEGIYHTDKWIPPHPSQLKDH